MGESLWHRVESVGSDLYAILGIPPSATDADVQRAWRSRARSTHPDTGGDPADFEQVHLAYLVLSEPTSRSRYDASRRSARSRPAVATQGAPESPADLTTPREPLPVRFLVVLAVVIVAAVMLSYVWPGFTLITGIGVGVFVLFRYHRQWTGRAGRIP